MTLCNIYNQFFDTIFQEADFSEEDSRKMKTSLTLIWFKRVSGKIVPLLSQEESLLINHLIQEINAPSADRDPTTAERLNLFLQNAARNQEILAVFFAEAESLLTHIASLFAQHASPAQLARVKSQLRNMTP